MMRAEDAKGERGMASRAMSRPQPADWRAAFRRSLARAGQLTGAVVLSRTMIFLALALVS
jgi:S-DNA-T family DNA segregation ATPase FtsK/SpoIIIE